MVIGKKLIFIETKLWHEFRKTILDNETTIKEILPNLIKDYIKKKK